MEKIDREALNGAVKRARSFIERTETSGAVMDIELLVAFAERCLAFGVPDAVFETAREEAKPENKADKDDPVIVETWML